jgi:prepilin-type N-terminal cleavage/methylation domain-containing protein/prepilin-type processing-associated H-X9-DG protein
MKRSGHTQRGHGPARPGGFSLVELLVVIAIISLLVAILVPSMSRAKKLAQIGICTSGVGSQLRAVALYASEENGLIPVGPDTLMPLPAGATETPTNEIASNQLWIGGDPGTFNAHGALFLKHLTQPEAFFCPGDDSTDPVEELAKLKERGDADAYCSYLYRQLDARDENAKISQAIEDLGFNAAGDRVRALIMDMNSRMQVPGMERHTRTNHGGTDVSVGFVDGHTKVVNNTDDSLTMRSGDEPDLFGRIDEIYQYADTLGR